MNTPLPASPVASAAAPTVGLFQRHRFKIIALMAVSVVLGVVALYTIAVLAFSYSKGDRIGFVQKLSKKGWICSTWEGELAMTTMPGVTPQIFGFSIRDEAVAKRVSAAEGKKVALVYEEKKGIPSSCFGETSYFVTDVRVLVP